MFKNGQIDFMVKLIDALRFRDCIYLFQESSYNKKLKKN